MWKHLELEGFQHYEVNDETGQIRNTTGKRAYRDIKGRRTSKNYIRVCLTDTDKNEKHFLLHDLIYWTFVEYFEITNEAQVGHLNNIGYDNRLVNLYKTNNEENENHLFDGIGRRQNISNSMKGNPLICQKVRCIETGIIYNSIKEAEEATGAKNISKVLSGERKTAGGYHWERVDDDEN